MGVHGLCGVVTRGAELDRGPGAMVLTGERSNSMSSGGAEGTRDPGRGRLNCVEAILE